MTLHATCRPSRSPRRISVSRHVPPCIRAGERSCKSRFQNASKKLKLGFQCSQQFSIVALTNSNGAITERYAFSAYGKPVFCNASGTDISVSAKDNRILYTGREWEEELKLYHFRARLYDAGVGRFLGRDPIGFAGSRCNVYEIAGARAVSEVDPLGLSSSVPDPCPGVNGEDWTALGQLSTLNRRTSGSFNFRYTSYVLGGILPWNTFHFIGSYHGHSRWQNIFDQSFGCNTAVDLSMEASIKSTMSTNNISSLVFGFGDVKYEFSESISSQIETSSTMTVSIKKAAVPCRDYRYLIYQEVHDLSVTWDRWFLIFNFSGWYHEGTFNSNLTVPLKRTEGLWCWRSCPPE